jgi:hypothetical protein
MGHVATGRPPARPPDQICRRGHVEPAVGEANTNCRRLAAHPAGVGVAIGIVGVVFGPDAVNGAAQYPCQPECPTRSHATTMANQC